MGLYTLALILVCNCKCSWHNGNHYLGLSPALLGGAPNALTFILAPPANATSAAGNPPLTSAIELFAK